MILPQLTMVDIPLMYFESELLFSENWGKNFSQGEKLPPDPQNIKWRVLDVQRQMHNTHIHYQNYFLLLSRRLH